MLPLNGALSQERKRHLFNQHSDQGREQWPDHRGLIWSLSENPFVILTSQMTLDLDFWLNSQMKTPCSHCTVCVKDEFVKYIHVNVPKAFCNPLWMFILIYGEGKKNNWLLLHDKDHSRHFSSVTQSCPTLCDPMNRSTPGLPVHHQLPGFTQTHVRQVSDAIQPSHPLSSPSPPAPSPSQHQDLFQWVNSSHEVAKVLESQLQQLACVKSLNLHSHPDVGTIISPVSQMSNLKHREVRNSPKITQPAGNGTLFLTWTA